MVEVRTDFSDALGDKLNLVELKITGTLISYYIVCERELWLFYHGLGMEEFSDYVLIGKLISESSFKRERFKEVLIGDSLKVDFLKVGDEIIVNEVKKSRKLEESHIWQVKFYIYSLRNYGINCKRGVIRYPKLYKKVDVGFSDEDAKKLEEAKIEIENVLSHPFPPPVAPKPYCRKCSYFEYCAI